MEAVTLLVPILAAMGIGAFLMSIHSKRQRKPGPETAPSILRPGECECGHRRCSHAKGVGECMALHTADENDKPLPQSEWSGCACQIYIKDDDDDDDSGPDPVTPTIDELERMVR